MRCNIIFCGTIGQIAGSNLHDFRWDHALFAGRKMLRDDFPADVTVLLIEARTTDFGVSLSPAISRAAAKVVDRVEALIRDRLQAAPCAVSSTSGTGLQPRPENPAAA